MTFAEVVVKDRSSPDIWDIFLEHEASLNISLISFEFKDISLNLQTQKSNTRGQDLKIHFDIWFMNLLPRVNEKLYNEKPGS